MTPPQAPPPARLPAHAETQSRAPKPKPGAFEGVLGERRPKAAAGRTQLRTAACSKDVDRIDALLRAPHPPAKKPLDDDEDRKGRLRDEPSIEDADADPAKHRHAIATDEADLLDPATRHLATLAPPAALAPPQAIDAPVATHARLSLEELLPVLVKRIAWSGDKHKGTVRLEIGAGAFEGATLLVHADAGRVTVEVGGRGDLDALRQKLDARLRRHGLDVERVA